LIKTCTNGFNSESKDVNNYGFGWSQFNQSYLPPNGFEPIYRAFQYKDEISLQGSSFSGDYNTYDGSGYIYELRGKLGYLQGNLSLLQQMEWVDRQTRAIFIEFSVYNPNINLVMVSTILVEFLHSGSILTTARFDPLNLFSETGGFNFKTITEIIFMGFILYFMINEIVEIIRRDLKEYLSEFWNYIEWSIILTACVSFFLVLARMKSAQEVLDFFKETQGYGHMNLQKANENNQVLTYSLGLCSSLGTIKFLKMLRFDRSISDLGLTLKSCFIELASFSMIFFWVFMSFAQLMHAIYVTDLEGYSTLIKSAESAFKMMLGKFDATQFVKSTNILAPVVFSLYNIVILCFALNIFISIITDAFDKIRNEAKMKPFEFDLIRHIRTKLKRYFESGSFQETNFMYKKHHIMFPTQVNRLISYISRVE